MQLAAWKGVGTALRPAGFVDRADGCQRTCGYQADDHMLPSCCYQLHDRHGTSTRAACVTLLMVHFSNGMCWALQIMIMLSCPAAAHDPGGQKARTPHVRAAVGSAVLHEMVNILH